MGVVFVVGGENSIGSPGAEAFSARAGASVDVGCPGGAVWTHGLGVMCFASMGVSGGSPCQ